MLLSQQKLCAVENSPGDVGVVAASASDFCEVRRAQRCRLAICLLPRLLLLLLLRLLRFLLLRLSSRLRLFPLHTYRVGACEICSLPSARVCRVVITSKPCTDRTAPLPCLWHDNAEALTLIVVPRVLTARSQHAITAAKVAARIGRADWMDPQHSSRPCGRSGSERQPRAALLKQAVHAVS